MDLTKTEAPRWTNGPRICETVNLPAFETVDALKAFFNSMGDGAIIIERIGKCQVCGGWHAETHARELSGSTSDSGSRHLTVKIPMEAEAYNRALSARASEQWQKGIYIPPPEKVKSGRPKQNRNLL